LYLRLLTALRANTVRLPPGPRRKSAGAGVAAFTASRILSKIAVVLCVVNTLAEAT
jgi:hypothetical protein